MPFGEVAVESDSRPRGAPAGNGEVPDALRLAAIVESSPDAIIGKTLDGVVVSWNPAAERMSGFTAEEMIGRPITTLLPRDHDNVAALLHKVRRGERVEHYETVGRAKDGHVINLSLEISPITDEEGAVVGISTIARDVTERKAADQRLGMLRELLEEAPDATVIADLDGRIALVNRQTEELLGYSRDELLGQPVEILVPRRLRDRHPSHRNRYFADPKVRPMGAGLELYAVRKDGSEFPVEISLSPLKNDSEAVVFATIRDATERKRAELKLERALAAERTASERLRELDRLKDEFLSTVSHELRTPLTVICALTEVLSKSTDGRENNAELLERILRNASDMHEMVERLLDYSRLEAGKVQLEVGPLRVREAALQCIELVRGAIGDRRVQLDAGDELTVRADIRGLQRILVNLLTNAAKYSQTGSTIFVSATAENGDATIAVEDQGIGIPAAQQARVFERFYQGADVSGKRGTGLGLSIVRRYVELLGGRVWLESEPGRGSTFLFSLPLWTASRSA